MDWETTYQPEAFHVVSTNCWNIFDTVEGRMSFAVLEFSMFLKSAEYLPAPLAVDRVACDAPHHKEALHCLGALQIVLVERLDNVVLLPLGFRIPAAGQAS